ncbi:27 kDa glycoprotein-like [Daphnia pulicaria]|uniref:27 kDa glycoprotein-like n=1 Tax=Daphnia pulicaria TaxID=35523 RepID=UPI001EEB54AD|nr:27 kDa glycoprotein-like [Daphnia pulicaria]
MNYSLFLTFVLVIGQVNCVIPSVKDAHNWAGELEKAQHDFNLDSYSKQWMDECERVNGSEAIEDIRESVTALTDCISSKINIHNITEEIKEASPKGILDEVFAKYCDQISAIKKCREPVILAMQVCLSDQADQDLEIFDEAISAAVDFMCYKGGERIAIFMSENGTDCFLSNIDNIATCLNGSLPELENAIKGIQTTNTSMFDDTNCGLETKMKACVINGLKTCSDPTPANVVEGLIDSMIKKTPCYKSEANYLNTSHSYHSSALLWALATLSMVTRFMFHS